MNSEFFIRYKNNSQINDSSFKTLLEKAYTVQSKPIWIPSATDGGEMWFQLFANTDFISFVKGAIAGGLAWDLIKIGGKKFFLRPFLNAVDKLVEENQDHSIIDLKRIEIEFNDITIRILGIRTKHTSKLSLIFKSIIYAYSKIENKKLGILSDIALPVVKKDGKFALVDEFEDLPFAEDYVKYWLLGFDLGLSRYIYDVGSNEIIS